jgi:3-isopropylmalate dehydrogenase
VSLGRNQERGWNLGPRIQALSTEGPYVGVGRNLKRDTPDEVAVQEDVNIRIGVERLLVYALEYARARGLKRVCR